MTLTDQLAKTLGAGTRAVLTQGAQSWSADEVEETTRQIATRLIAAGVGRDDIVEIDTDDHVEAIQLMIAVLRAGAAFCVVPSAYPAARVETIRRRTRPAYILTGIAAALEAPAAPADTALPQRDSDSLTYVIFTSGSTGDPKAVEITDGNVGYLAAQPDIYPGEVIGHLAALQFDACIYEILGGLLNGKTIAVLDLDELLDRTTAVAALAGVDILFVTTAIFNLLSERSPEALEQPEIVLFGGERVSPRHVRNALGRSRLFHVYGPTEATVFATIHEIRELPEGADVPIGRGLVGSCVHVLDDAGDAVSPGETGELLVGGAGLMRGYRDQPEATEAAMTTLHDEPHYRTGDLVTLQDNGEVVFAGRKDRQVKISGFRVDPAEVEKVALGFAATGAKITNAVAVVDDGKLRLFVTGCTSALGLRSYLRTQLPHFLVPVVTPVGFLPLTPNGKTDTTALIAQAHAMTPAQERAREVFAALVDTTPLDAEVTFVDLGGDSLTAMDAVWQLDQAGVGVDMGALLTQPLETVLRNVA